MSYGPSSDGAVHAGAVLSYIDNGDGTVTDNNTGLMWETKDDANGIHDKDTQYSWGMATAPYTMNGGVIDFLTALNTPPCLADHCDWRIPNLRELESIANYGVPGLPVDAAFNFACTEGCTTTTCSCTGSVYWSSTTAGDGHVARAFSFSPDDGAGVLSDPKGEFTLFVRAVRAGGAVLATGQTAAFGSGSDGAIRAGTPLAYTDNGDGTISNDTTGLMWEKKDDAGGIHDQDNVYTWGMNASPYSMNGAVVTEFLTTLNTPPCFAEYCDWRIPNIRELQSILNYEAQTTGPAVSGAFDADCQPGCTVTTCSCAGPVHTPFSFFYWSSTTNANDPSATWVVVFDNRMREFQPGGYSFGSALKGNGGGVRAVRAGR